MSWISAHELVSRADSNDLRWMNRHNMPPYSPGLATRNGTGKPEVPSGPAWLERSLRARSWSTLRLPNVAGEMSLYTGVHPGEVVASAPRGCPSCATGDCALHEEIT